MQTKQNETKNKTKASHLHTHTKKDLECTTNLNVDHETIEALEDSTGENRDLLGYGGNIFKIYFRDPYSVLTGQSSTCSTSISYGHRLKSQLLQF